MRKLFLVSALVSATLMVSGSAAGRGPDGTFEYHEDGRGIAHSNAVIDVKQATTVVMQTFMLDPGFNGLWSTHPGDTLIVVKGGSLAAYANCADKEMWEGGHAYFRPAGRPGHGNTLIKNEGKAPAELVVTFFDVPSDQPAGSVPAAVPPAGETCAPPGTLTPTELSRVLTYDADKIEIQAGKNLVVQSFVVEPGFNFFWHKHPGPTLVFQNKGTITEYTTCTEQELWEPGYAYIHTPGHHGQNQETAKNEGKDTAEFVVIFFNVPEWHPAPLVPRDVQPPPSDCPTASL
jgi:quercetin dioxygenase-like cupin family protein